VKVHNILVPFDFSPSSEQALETAVIMARQLHSELHLVHVLDAKANSDLERIAL